MVFYEKMEHQRLGEILIENELISEDQLKEALGKQKELGLKLGSTLIALEFVTQDDINWVLHKQFNIPQITLTKDMVDIELISLIPDDIFKGSEILPLSKSGNELTICIADPTDFEVLKKLEKSTGYNLNVAIADVETIKGVKRDITLIISGEKEKAQTQLELVAEPVPKEILMKLMEDSTGNMFFDFIFNTLVTMNLDAISIIPLEKNFTIYYDFLGKHFSKFNIPIQYYSIVKSKALQLFSLEDEYGYHKYYRVKYPIGKTLRDFKLIIISTPFGDMFKVFNIRTLNKVAPLNKEGLSREQLDLVFSNLILQHGSFFILGKDPNISINLLFSLIGEFANFGKKIAYFDNFNILDIDGVINLKDVFYPGTDEDLPHTLIDSLNPDVLFFRELKTPNQLYQALHYGYTGKVVLAYIREQDIFNFIINLFDSKIDNFTLKNSLKLVIHHEKVEELCPNCKRAFTPNMDYLTTFQNQKIEETNFYRKVGCKECRGFGYKNLMDVYEVFKIDNFVRTNMENSEIFSKMVKEFKSQGYIGTKTKILSLIASGTIPFNSIIDIH